MQVKNERSGNCVQNGRKVQGSNPAWAANLLSDGMPCVYYSRVFGVGYVQSVTVPCSKLGLLGESLNKVKTKFIFVFILFFFGQNVHY